MLFRARPRRTRPTRARRRHLGHVEGDAGTDRAERRRRVQMTARAGGGQDAPMNDTGGGGVLANARGRPDAIALRIDDDAYTYAELSAAARDLAHALHEL